jgi:molybdopterin/thiamine biosynthesis adenylyltransferase
MSRGVALLTDEEPDALLRAWRAGEPDGFAGQALERIPEPQAEFLALFISSDDDPVRSACRAFWCDRNGRHARECALQAIPARSELFTRTRGLLETDLLAGKRVVIIGLGSGGSICAVELAKCGVGQFDLFDFDRLELHNVARHCCGVSDLGRYKTRAVRDLILDKNPHCRVNTHEVDITADAAALERAIEAADLVIAGTDNNGSRFTINALCLQFGKVCLYGRAMSRACGGDVFRVRPNQGPCYACLVGRLPMVNEEVSSLHRPLEIPEYAFREMVAQPGLSNDIYPLATFQVKLAIQELARGSGSPLETLDADLVGDYYFWANRREEQYQKFSPMRYQWDKITICRWYAVKVPRDPQCAACGEFTVDSLLAERSSDPSAPLGERGYWP